MQAQSRSLADRLLAVVIETAKATGDEFLRALVSSLARVLGVKCAFVGQLVEGRRRHFRTLAVWFDGRPGDGCELEISGTPWEAIGEKRVCWLAGRAESHHARDPVLEKWGAVGYLGAPLVGSSGRVLGVLAIADGKAMEISPEEAETLLEALTSRAAAELERQAVASALRETEERYRALFDCSRLLIYVLDLDGGVVDANDAALKLLGYERADLPRLCFADLVVQDDLPSAARAIEEAKRRGATVGPYEYRVKAKNGGTKILRTTAALVCREGQPYGVQGIAEDITEAVSKRRRAQEHEKLVAIGKIAAGIAHEIKNPLFAISSGIELLMDELTLDDEQRETFEIVHKDIRRMDRLVQQLLFLSSRREPQRSVQPVVALVREAITLHRGVLADKSLRVVEAFEPDLPDLLVDRDRIHQVIINLLQNAVAVSQDGGVIEVGAGHVEGRRAVAIHVRDHGDGFVDEFAARIFEPFFTTKKGSSGLGLSISLSIAEEHGGTLEAHNHEDGGAVFSLVLPLETEE